MIMKQCPNGHFYDASVNSECPFCNSGSANVNLNATTPVMNDDNKTSPPINFNNANSNPYNAQPMQYENIYSNSANDGKTMPIMKNKPNDDSRTVPVIIKSTGLDPVVGWLVCIEGAEKGKDYRIHTDNNFIGRQENMDICIRNDDTISREKHAMISFDSQDRVFYLTPLDGRSIIRFNDKAIFQTVQLEPLSKIQLGNSVFLFMPFCGQGFSWEE